MEFGRDEEMGTLRVGFLADKAVEFLEYGRIAGEILVLTSMGPDLWEFEIGLSTCVIGDIEI